MKYPWREWIPGVLSKRQIRELFDKGYIEGVSKEKDLDGSSLDLHLSREGYYMAAGYSVKPTSAQGYVGLIQKEGSAVALPSESDNTFFLDRRKTYVFKLQERLSSELWRAGFHGQATAKSSVGRVDVLARLVVEGMDRYEGFDPSLERAGYKSGHMYLEITPMTFNVKVRAGDALSQLRLFYGRPEDAEISSEEVYETVLGGKEKKEVWEWT